MTAVRATIIDRTCSRWARAGLVALALLAIAGCRKEARRPGPVVTITLSFAGASVDEMEQMVVVPIEEELAKLTGVRSIRSTIDAGSAFVAVEIGHATTIADLQRVVADLRSKLPEELDFPTITKFGPDERPALWLEVSGPAPAAELSEIAREAIARRLERLPGVANIELRGDVRRAIVVRPDLARLEAARITILDVAAALGSGTTDLPAGRIGATDHVIRTVGPVRDLASLLEIVVRVHDGSPIRIADLAVIEEGLEREPEADADGGPPMLGILVQRGARRSAVLAAVRSEVAALRATLPPQVMVTETAGPAAPSRGPAPLAVSVLGQDWTTLTELATKLERELRASGVASEIVSDLVAGKPELQVHIDRTRAAELGVPAHAIAKTIRLVLVDETVGTWTSGTRRTDIVLRVSSDARASTETLGQLLLRGPNDVLVPMSSLTTTSTGLAATTRTRRDGSRAITLSIYLAPGQALPAARGRIAELTRDLPAGYRAIVSP